MNWLILALIAPVFWSFTNIFDKMILSKYKVRPFDYMLIGGLIWISTAIFTPLADFSNITFWIILGGLSVGMMRVLSFYFYNQAMKREEASRVSPLSNIGNLFVLVLSIIFLKEILDLNQTIAFFLILFGATFLSIKKTKGIFKISPALVYILLATGVFSISLVFLKYLYGYMTYWTAIVLLGIGEALFCLIILLLNKKRRKRFIKNLGNLPSIVFLFIIASGISAMVAALTSTKAFELGPVALVSVIGGLTSVFVLIWATALSKYYPKILKEKYNFKILLLKSFSISLMLIGLYLLSK